MRPSRLKERSQIAVIHYSYRQQAIIRCSCKVAAVNHSCTPRSCQVGLTLSLGVHSEGKHGGVGGGKHGGKHGGKKKPRQMAEKRQMAKAPPSGDAA